MKKWWIVILVVVFAIAIIITFLLIGKNRSKPQSEKPQTVEEAIITPTIEDLSYFSLVPRRDGNAFNLIVKRIPNDASIDYEITYTTLENLSQGIVGEAKAGQNEYQYEHLFGTCSKNVCKYDKGVEFGQLTAQFKEPQKRYHTSFDFHLQNLGFVGGKLSLKDESASLDIPAGAISSSQFFISHQTGGLPSSVKEKILIGSPVGFFSSAGDRLSKEATLTVNLPKTPEGEVVAWGWDGKNEKWVEFPAEIKESKVTSKVNLLTAYIVIGKEAK